MLEPDESAGGVSHTWLSGEVGEVGEVGEDGGWGGANLRFNINFVEFRLVQTDTQKTWLNAAVGGGAYNAGNAWEAYQM